MKTKSIKGNTTEEVANDLKQNPEKINHHGKRAGDFVKGMLQHSRNSSGAKEPTVSIATATIQPPSKGRGITINVSDNGAGIPQKAFDKIFQPFFTTKPTGQGTELGLSLSYDIVKAHGGELNIETREGEGSEFIIQLPDSL